MIKTCAVIFVLFINLFGDTYSASKAKYHIGESATICGKVVSTYYAYNSNGEPTFLNLDRPYPNNIFTVVIWGNVRDNFDRPEKKYKYKNVCVSGYIDSYNGIPQIEIESKKQIVIK